MSWAIIVDLVPASSRPYVGSSSNNSEVELIIGHNGAERFGNSLGAGGRMGKGMPNAAEMKNMMKSGKLPKGFNPIKGKSSGKMPSGFGGFGGQNGVGITRFFSKGELADQISWLLPLALFGFIATAFKEKLKKPFDNGKKLSIVFWITYLVPQFIYFSFTSGMFHPYYLTMLSVPIAALVGIGMKSMWELYKENTWKSYLLPAAFIADGALELLILSYYLDTSSITKVLMATVVILSFVSAIALIINKIKTKNEQKSIKELKLRNTLVSLGLVGLLITPTVWSGTTLFYKMSGSMPSAGLELSKSKDSNNIGGMMGAPTKLENGLRNAVDSSKLTKYLVANKTKEKHILVTLSALGDASSLILGSNESAMALGGFISTDKIITLNQFKQMVKKGEVRYIMVQSMLSGMQSGDTSNQNTEIMNWSKKHGKLVEKSQWSDSSDKKNKDSKQNSAGSSSQKTQGFNMSGSAELYDLQGSITD
jgi:4-amino-4-deoxy-L-arabinose transferase-like glycosyltransferase